MPRSIRSIPLLAVLAVAVGFPGAAAAGGPVPGRANGCPPRTACDHALGVALVPPPGWQRVPPGHWPPHRLAWFSQPPLGLDYNIRLLIGPDGTTKNRNAAHAAAAVAQKLISGYRGLHPTRYAVRYGGAPGVLIRGLPGGPGPDAFIILAHQGALYSIIAPGARLAPDQQQALASLRFIPRVGPFPPANPPAPNSPPVHRTVKGGTFSGTTLTLTPGNSIHRAGQAESLVVGARKGWTLTYSVGCSGARSRLVVRVTSVSGRVLDRVLHRAGAARDVREVENIAGPFRLEVKTTCPTWRVTASPVYG